jgi:hypothetical protein
VNTFDTLGATTGHESENAMNAARNKAAKLGANAIKIIHMQTTFQGTTVSAEALDCNFGRENLQSSPKAAVYPARSPGADEQAVQNPTVGQQLIDLQKAKDAGAITDSEYQTQKAKLLGNK